MKRFRNPPGSAIPSKNPFHWLRFFRRRYQEPSPSIPKGYVLPTDVVLNSLKENLDNAIVWLGHDTFIINISGITILTDPFFSEYASPIQGVGFKRFIKSPVDVEQLPFIDIVLVSHDHFDHLDCSALKKLSHKNTIQSVFPLGLGKYFRKAGFKHTAELNWFDSWEGEGVKITATPAIHFSKRHLLRRNTSLWSSFVMEIDGVKIFFAGDTGYHPSVFKAIGDRFGGIDYAFLPIGAYAPSHLMQAIHVNPEEAVQIAQDIHAKFLIAMHWGTIRLSDEPCFEPPKLFKHYAIQAGYTPENIWIFKIGEAKYL